MLTNYNKLLIVVSIAIASLLFISESIAGSLTPPFQIQVEVDSLNVQDAPPRFNWKTVVTGSYVLSPPKDVLAKAQQVKVIAKKLIGTGKLWLQIEYNKQGEKKAGWIYAGTEKNVVNIKLLNVPQSSLLLKQVQPISKKIKIELIDFIIGTASAEETPNLVTGTSGQQVAPDLSDVSKLYRTISLLIYVSMFVASLLVTFKVTNNGFLSFFTGLGVLLILGFITEDVFSVALAGMK